MEVWRRWAQLKRAVELDRRERCLGAGNNSASLSTQIHCPSGQAKAGDALSIQVQVRHKPRRWLKWRTRRKDDMCLNFKTAVELDALEAGAGWVHRHVHAWHGGAQVIDVRAVVCGSGPGGGGQEEQHHDDQQRREGATPFGGEPVLTLFLIGENKGTISQSVPGKNC